LVNIFVKYVLMFRFKRTQHVLHKHTLLRKLVNFQTAMFRK